MSSLEETQALGHADFWDERYAKADGEKPTHEWFRAFDALEPFFAKHLFRGRGSERKDKKVLHLGSGDSTIPYDLLERGYTNQICIDFSTAVVDLMKSRHTDKPEVDWKVGDVRNMTDVDTQSVDVLRVLKDNSVFLYATYREPRFIKPIINRENEWDLEMEIMGGGDSFEYFGFILKKHNSATSV
ncbi:hypothetical protein CC86DRAFT_392513 [Ophiobolus disseminans]|uniref:Uncharacterized protein n=1 Tax=Ophiobolus disseminans TaxID=1469910 RepID=A0A6A7A9B1_9PLEO|nr:hypothetical protein CC86DRAFT_392513 [Ophiobolus disseminans]